MWIPGSPTWADQDWGRIDHILVDRSSFQNLKKLDLRLWVHQGASDYEKQKSMAHFKTTKLPLLCLAADDYLDFNIVYF
jgi:phage pi2 protein 07